MKYKLLLAQGLSRDLLTSERVPTLYHMPIGCLTLIIIVQVLFAVKIFSRKRQSAKIQRMKIFSDE